VNRGFSRPVPYGHIARLAAELWSDAGGSDGYPRDPEPLIGLYLPVSVVDLHNLSCGTLARWAERNGLPAVVAAPDRRLRGCLLAYGGEAFLIVDPDDPPEQRRVTIAHEIGHYLIEIWEPRRRVRRTLGEGTLPVLDGVRPPTFAERLQAILAGASLEPHVHLMAREEDGSISCVRVAAAECAADRFALELLAPRATLRPVVVELAGRPLQQRWALTTETLIQHFGLPAIVAGGYAKDLVHELTGGRSVREWLSL
jgi:hypothetical protein